MTALEEHAKQHQTKRPFLGITIQNYRQEIKLLLDRHECDRVLDFGCGQARPYLNVGMNEYFGRDTSVYDPGVPQFSQRPEGTFAAVICIDVAEHVEESDLDAFFDDIFQYAHKLVYITICTRPSRKLLPNGRNAHVTLKPFDWWLAKIRERNKNNLFVYVRHTP